MATDAEHIGYEARPLQSKHGDGRGNRRKHGNSLPDRRITLDDIASGRVKGRSSPDQITYSERGNLQGAQFYAVAGRVYELAKRAGLGREIPTEWFLQDIRN
jgi:ornithine cyclodeaminase/alanine dehydrogenase-like protein (mu-crystallin family)